MSSPLGLCRYLTRSDSKNPKMKLRFRIDTSFKLVKRMCKYNTHIVKNPERNIRKYCYVMDYYQNDERIL